MTFDLNSEAPSLTMIDSEKSRIDKEIKRLKKKDLLLSIPLGAVAIAGFYFFFLREPSDSAAATALMVGLCLISYILFRTHKLETRIKDLWKKEDELQPIDANLDLEVFALCLAFSECDEYRRKVLNKQRALVIGEVKLFQEYRQTKDLNPELSKRLQSSKSLNIQEIC
jgi:hypothetical protein